MKKAEEYIKDVQIYQERITKVGSFEWVENLEKDKLISIIKFVQEDTIRATVRECAVIGLINDHVLYDVADKLIKEL